MTDEINKLLLDIKTSISSIEDFIGSSPSFEKYLSNKMMRRAVERELEIIGEALNRIDNITPEIPLSNKKLIIGMRNRVIHGYDKIDENIVWGVIIRHLPLLKTEVNSLYGAAPDLF